MKKLSKIKLQNAVILEDQEMKKIYGGSGGSSTCSKNGETCSGSCPDGVMIGPGGTQIPFKRSCNSYGGANGIVCMCG